MEEREYIREMGKERKSQPEMVNHPPHYQAGGLECIDVMEKLFGIDWVYHFCVLNAFKYQWRCNNKGKTVEDFRKAIWYNNKAVELLERMEGGATNE